MAKFNQWWLLAFAAVFIAVLYFLSPLLMPFVIGTFIAYLGAPLVGWLERFKVRRSFGVLLVFLLFSIVFIGLVLLFLPEAMRQISRVVENIPALILWLQSVLMPFLGSQMGVPMHFDPTSIQNFVIEHIPPIRNVTIWFLQALFYSGHTLLTALLDFVLVLIVSFYFMRDWPQLLSRAALLVPRMQLPTVTRLTLDCNNVLGAFFRGQLLVMLALAFYYSVALSLVHLPGSVLIGLLIGLFSVVPLLGTIVSFALAGLVAVFHFDMLHLFIVLGIIGFGHVLENFIMVPWLIGDRVGLHPVAVIFAVLAGGLLFGFMGVLLAVPVAAVFLIFLKELFLRYRQSVLFQRLSADEQD